MQKVLGFGEKVTGYDVPVLNERELRAAAGLLFVAAFYAFMNVWLVGNYFPIKLFISGFLVDFIIRLGINPRYAPSLIIGRWIVRQQKVEYTGAPQKKFAWIIGLLMSSYMFVSLVLLNQATLFACALCLICLVFLFFESAFGICIGCALYNTIHKDKAHYCPGGVCEVHQLEPIQQLSWWHGVIVLLMVGALVLWTKTPWLQLRQSAVTGANCALGQLGGQTNPSTYSCAPASVK